MFHVLIKSTKGYLGDLGERWGYGRCQQSLQKISTKFTFGITAPFLTMYRCSCDHSGFLSNTKGATMFEY